MEHRRLSRGFTLIELLVVIAIIAILAAILFPVFAQAREKARQTQCMSNEKQIALGVLQYVQDNEETYPMPYGWDPSYQPWHDTIQPYVKSYAVFHCPDDTIPRHDYNGNSVSTPISYSISGVSERWDPYNRPTFSRAHAVLGQSEASITSPASTILISARWREHHARENGGDSTNSGCDMWDSMYEFDGNTTSYDRSGPLNSHTKGSLYAFADGHVKMMRLMDTLKKVGNEQSVSDIAAATDLGSTYGCGYSWSSQYFGMWDKAQ